MKLRGEIYRIKDGGAFGVASSYNLVLILSNPKNSTNQTGDFRTLMVAPIAVRKRKSVGPTTAAFTGEAAKIDSDIHILCHYTYPIESAVFEEMIGVLSPSDMDKVDIALSVAVGLSPVEVK